VHAIGCLSEANFAVGFGREGTAGSALRNGMVAAQHRLEDMGLRERDPNRVKIDVNSINTRPLAGDTRQVYALAKLRNRGHGNILDHATISGCGVGPLG
jgi:hypothetical protein